MFFQLVLFQSPSIAAISASDGAAKGQAQVNKIGKLLLAEGIATLTATTIEIASNNQSGQPQTQLQGKLFKTEQSGKVFRGLAFFNKGPMLSDIDSGNCNDYVIKIDGSKVSGPVSDVTGSALTCAGQSIPLGEVSKIHSARVFKYNTKVGDSPKLKLKATCIKGKPGSTSRMSTKKKLIIATVAVCMIVGIACGIAIPLAVAGGGRSSSPPTFIAPAPAPVRSVPAPSGP